MTDDEFIKHIEEMHLSEGTVHVNKELLKSKRKTHLLPYSIRKKILLVAIGISTVLSAMGCAKGKNVEPTQNTVAIETEANTESNDEEDIVEETTSVEDSSVDEENLETSEEYDLGSLFNNVSVTSITNNMKTPEEIAQEISTSIGGTYTGPTTTVTSESGKTSTWVSEEDAEIAKETGLLDAAAGETVVTVEGDNVIGADGDVYVSEEAANRESHNNEVVSTSGLTGTEYVDSQTGEQWEDQGQYDAFQDGGVITDGPGVGTVVEKGDGYEADNGELWESRQDYLEDLYGADYNFDDGYYDDEYDDGYYDDHYDDGYYDDEYDDYYDDGYYDDEYDNGYYGEGTVVVEDGGSYKPPVYDELGGYQDDAGYHINGGVYASKEVYLEIKDLPVAGEDTVSYETENNDEYETGNIDENAVTYEVGDIVDVQPSTGGDENYVGDVVVEDGGSYKAPVYDELGGYQDDVGYHINGGIYPSKADYLEWGDAPLSEGNVNLDEESNAKTR